MITVKDVARRAKVSTATVSHVCLNDDVVEGLEDLINDHGFLSHGEAVRVCREADALMLFVAPERGPSASTGKLYEYLAARRPVLAVVPEDGEAARIVRETGAGIVVPAADVARCKAALMDLIDRWRRGDDATGATGDIERYSREHLTGVLADELNAIIGDGRAAPERRSEQDLAGYHPTEGL